MLLQIPSALSYEQVPLVFGKPAGIFNGDSWAWPVELHIQILERPNQTPGDSEEGGVRTVYCFDIQLCLILQKPVNIKSTK